MTNIKDHHCGCEKINIDCKAQECTYNDQRKCTASAIDVPDAAQTDVTKQNVIPSPANADPDAQKDAASNSVFLCLNHSVSDPVASYLFLRKSGIWISFFCTVLVGTLPV